jgi:hypothetical protein
MLWKKANPSERMDDSKGNSGSYRGFGHYNISGTKKEQNQVLLFFVFIFYIMDF